MGEAHLAAVVGERGRRLAVGQRAVLLLGDAPPRAEVHLVDVERAAEVVLRRAPPHPLVVGELVGGLEDDGGGAGRHLGEAGEGVGLEEGRAARAVDLVLVDGAGADVGDEELPDAGDAELAHLVEAPVPVVEVADDADAVGGRRPDGERDAAHVAEVADVRAQLLVDVPVAALVEEVLVERAEGGHEGVGVELRERRAAGVVDAQAVGEELHAPRQPELEEAARVRPRHLARAFALDDQLDALGLGPEGPHDRAPRRQVRAEDGVRVLRPQREQPLDLRPRDGRVLARPRLCLLVRHTGFALTLIYNEPSFTQGWTG